MIGKIERLRKKIEAGETILGTHTCWGGAMLAEMYGMAGFDAVWIDCEHGAVDSSQLLNTLVGVNTSDMCAFVRIAANDPVLAKPVLDMGVEGIVFPMVLTADDARRAVAACHYPPAGMRGFGPVRAVGYGTVDVDAYIRTHSKEVWPLIQIEHIDAVRNIDEILAVPGIAAIIVGPCDLSGSLGMLGQINHAEVKKCIDTVTEKAKKAGVPFGVSMGYNEEAARDWAARGANFIFADNEPAYIIKGCRHTLKNLRRILAE